MNGGRRVGALARRRRTGRAALGAALFASLGLFGCARSGERSPPSVLLISIDTLRADHLGAYGAKRGATPAIDALAARGVVFEHAIAQASWTLPSMASLLTSLYPSEHGAVGAATRLPEAVETLAESLRGRRYRSIGIVSHSFLDTAHGMAQGFDHFDEAEARAGHDGVTSEPLTRKAVEQLRGLPAGTPFFLWVHYFDPHFTYVRHPEFAFAAGYGGPLPAALPAGLLNALAGAPSGTLTARDLDYVKAVYDEEIASTDRWIGVLLAELERLGRAGSTVVVLTADHGEFFLERGRFFHGRDVYEPLVHVPLVIGGAVPERLRGRRVRGTVELASVPKTIMGLVAGPSGFRGVDLLSLPDTGMPADTPAYTEGNHAWGTDGRKKAVLANGFKLVHNLDDDRFELYRLGDDPGEQRNLWSDADAELARVRDLLKRRLERFPPSRAASTGIELEAGSAERLRSLGYVK